MSSSVFRIDKFVVPEGGKHEFVQRVRETHEFLRTLPGFVRDLVVEKTAGAGVFNYVTLVEWESEEAISTAKNAVHAHHGAAILVRKNYGLVSALKPTSRTTKKLFCNGKRCPTRRSTSLPSVAGRCAIKPRSTG